MKKVEYEQKQVVAQKKSVKWKCEICGKEYTDQGDAYTCEKIHKNKEALSKIEPKFKAGDVVTYVNKWTGLTRIGHIFNAVPVDEYERWAYNVYSNFKDYVILLEESEITPICTKEEYQDIVSGIISKVKKQMGVSKKRVCVTLESNGEFTITFTTKDDKIPVIERKD